MSFPINKQQHPFAVRSLFPVGDVMAWRNRYGIVPRGAQGRQSDKQVNSNPVPRLSLLLHFVETDLV
jgi:hypothetical protein